VALWVLTQIPEESGPVEDQDDDAAPTLAPTTTRSRLGLLAASCVVGPPCNGSRCRFSAAINHNKRPSASVTRELTNKVSAGNKVADSEGVSPTRTSAMRASSFVAQSPSAPAVPTATQALWPAASSAKTPSILQASDSEETRADTGVLPSAMSI